MKRFSRILECFDLSSGEYITEAFHLENTVLDIFYVLHPFIIEISDDIFC